MNILKYNYEVEKREAFNRLKTKTETRISEINIELKKIREEIADQLAIKELYSFREAKGQSGHDGTIRKANEKAIELEERNEETINKLKNEKQALEFDLDSLNELLK